MPNRTYQYNLLKLLTYMTSIGGEGRAEKSICVTQSQFLARKDYLEIYHSLRKKAEKKWVWGK
jgi:hypothetical protein